MYCQTDRVVRASTARKLRIGVAVNAGDGNLLHGMLHQNAGKYFGGNDDEEAGGEDASGSWCDVTGDGRWNKDLRGSR